MDNSEIINLNDSPQYLFDTLVLGGGAIKGICILGALQYVIDNYYIKNVKTMVGTSVGALICYLLAIGYTPIDIMIKICTTQMMESLHASMNITGVISDGEGLLDFSLIRDIIEKLTLDKIGFYPTMKDILVKFNKKLIFTTYNITKDELTYLNPIDNPDLPCIIALRMTCNLPFIFDKFKYMDNYYIDGGILDNFPAKKASTEGENVLGFYSIIENYNEDMDKKINIFSYAMRLIYILPLRLLKQEVKTSNGVFIEIKDSNYLLNFNLTTPQKMDMFSNGYQCAKSYFQNK